MSYRISLFCFLLGLALIASAVLVDKSSGKNDDAKIAEIAYNLSKKIHQLEQEATSLSAGDSMAWLKTSYSFFLMDSVNVLRWTTNYFLPDIRAVQDDFTLRLLQWPRGIFLLRKWKLGDSNFLLGVLPLQDRYKINNRYLVSSWNEEIFPIQEVSISEEPGNGYPFIWEGKLLFSLQITNALTTTEKPWYVFVLVTLGIIFLFTGFSFMARKLHCQSQFGWTFLFMILFFIGGRILMLSLFSSPETELFNPIYFASSSYNRSMGDLLLNSIAVLIPVGYIFFNYRKLKCIQWLYNSSDILRNLLAIVFMLLSFFTFLFPFLFFETIYHNSTISLDIAHTLHVDWIRLFSYLAIILGCVSGFMLTHVFFKMAQLLQGKGLIPFFMHLILATILFFILSQLLERDYRITLVVFIFYLIVIKFLKLSKNLFRTNYATFLYIFIAIIAFALQGSISIRKFVIEDKINSQFRFANSFLIDRDFLAEYLLGESVQRISADPFIQTRLGSPFLSKTSVRQKVKQVYLNSYFDRYDITIHLFNSAGTSFDNSTSLEFTQFISGFQQDAIKTGYEGVFFLKKLRPESTKGYLAVIPVSRFGVATGYVVLGLTLKRIIPRNVFPELLLDDRFTQYFKNRDFSYVFFTSGMVSSSFGDFNYERDFPVTLLKEPDLFDQGIAHENFIHVGVTDESGNVTVVSSRDYSLLSVATNFSFLFTIGLNLVLLALLLYGAATLFNRSQLNYSARIQLYVYLAFVLPLFLVSFTTLGLISKSAENQIKEEYLDKSKLLGERIAPLVDTLLTALPGASGDLDNAVIELARLANADVTLFSPNGKLITSSQPLIYEDRILSSLMNREAFERITYQREQSFVNSEHIGSLTYNSSYFALKSPATGKLIGILSLPFFESAYSLEKTQINAVSTIITIFCVVFILFSVLSYFAVRWLTFPLQFITRTLRRTTFTGSNSPLVWKSNDEIGLMVNEYNKMVENLERSKIDLSRIQKESAWREIAKQVAHEVKNPLTPMKLTLQQMEKALYQGSLSDEKTKHSIQTLLQQVEILNDIAASFSAFARMPAPILQKLDLTALLKRVVHLHGDYKEGIVSIESIPDTVYVMGDEQLLSRVFSNIIINGLQSGEEGNKVRVRVEVRIDNNRCLISFKDNGKGIEKELLDKVFLPHFSTKKTGSGIGLAIAKQGVEQNGGTIYFETEEGKGTTFVVELPTI